MRIKELAVVEKEATKLSFTWAHLPLDDPRILLKQNECKLFESSPGDSTKMLDQGSRIQSVYVHIRRPAALQDGGVVGGCGRP